MSLRVLTADVTVAAGAITQDTTSGVGNGSQTTLGTLWAPLWPTTFRKGTVMDVQAGSKLETAIGAGNLRAYAATDLTGRDGISN
jgi:hypothetical protein